MPRIRESDLILPTLRILSSRADGFAKTSELIVELEAYFSPEGVDASLLEGRNDTHFSQKVRNLVSHREASTGLQRRGWAVYSHEDEGWTITNSGRQFVTQMDET